MAAILAGVGPGDEVIMPSYTFVSTANAFVLRGATPVFVDVRPDTLNLDESRIEAAITPRTRAVVVVHYAGFACDMDRILDICQRHGLLLIEDAAQALLSQYRGRPLGSIGHLATLSFHETKNVMSGEGGALLINDDRFVERAQFIREKGTNRTQFLEGCVDKYTWVDVGSSYLPGELIAAFLWGQIEAADSITARRMRIWQAYHEAFAPLEREGWLRRPTVPAGSRGNGHLYYLLLPSGSDRAAFIATLQAEGVGCVFHYVPLHNSPAGLRHCRTSGTLEHTEDCSARLVRMPLWLGVESALPRVVAAVARACSKLLTRTTVVPLPTLRFEGRPALRQ